MFELKTATFALLLCDDWLC